MDEIRKKSTLISNSGQDIAYNRDTAQSIKFAVIIDSVIKKLMIIKSFLRDKRGGGSKKSRKSDWAKKTMKHFSFNKKTKVQRFVNF